MAHFVPNSTQNNYVCHVLCVIATVYLLLIPTEKNGMLVVQLMGLMTSSGKRWSCCLSGWRTAVPALLPARSGELVAEFAK